MIWLIWTGQRQHRRQVVVTGRHIFWAKLVIFNSFIFCAKKQQILHRGFFYSTAFADYSLTRWHSGRHQGTIRSIEWFSSYRKQIARHHMPQLFGQAGGVVDPVEIFFSSCLIFMQNLVAVCHIARVPKIWGYTGVPPFGIGIVHKHAFSHVCYHENLVALGQTVWA